ncbi:fluoride efflux transporter CrcB [Veillonella montpellierensis]|uniref:fluoride efflux transporter CrcB n=1 Tax=Veillonella montpellierensis TaxID=187328 RepID=UPI00068873C0|nr:fluoride efflux transporter CrcB [Veillonella montpellierensis]
MKLLMIAIGGALGAICRVYGSDWIQQRSYYGIPCGTIAVNLLGALLIGLCLGYMSARPDMPVWVKFLVVSGGLGGFTTFSTCMYEAIELVMVGQYLHAACYIGIQFIAGLVLCFIGISISKLLV